MLKKAAGDLREGLKLWII